MASADITIATIMATIQSDTTQRTVTLSSGAHWSITNVGANPARVGIIGATLAAAGTGTNSDGQRDLLAGATMILPRGCTGFTHLAGSGTALAVSNGAG